jgi:hypothetical protein
MSIYEPSFQRPLSYIKPVQKTLAQPEGMSRGCVDGRALDDWLAAEEEVNRAMPEGAGPSPRAG